MSQRRDAYFKKLVDFIEGSNDLEEIVTYVMDNDPEEERQVVKARLLANKLANSASSIADCQSIGGVVGILMLNMFVTAQAIKEITAGALNSDDLMDLAKLTDTIERNIHLKQDKASVEKTHSVLSYVSDLISGNDPEKASLYDPQPEDEDEAPVFVSQYIGNLVDDLEESNVISVNGSYRGGRDNDEDEEDNELEEEAGYTDIPGFSKEENAFFKMVDELLDEKWGLADQDPDVKH